MPLDTIVTLYKGTIFFLTCHESRVRSLVYRQAPRTNETRHYSFLVTLNLLIFHDFFDFLYIGMTPQQNRTDPALHHFILIFCSILRVMREHSHCCSTLYSISFPNSTQLKTDLCGKYTLPELCAQLQGKQN